MRHAGGRSTTFTWSVALCTFAACTSALPRPSESTQAPTSSAETCILGEVSPQGRDSALIVFRVAGAGVLSAEHDTCAMRLAAATLRPWLTTSHDRWTVEIVPSDEGATAYRLGRKRARDAIDGGATLIATEDLDLVAYASTRPDLHVTPLAWDRTYLRLSPLPVDSLGSELAWDAVRVDARPPEAIACDTASTAAVSTARPQGARVIYEAGDRTARELAERVVAIAPESAEVAGLSRAELESALHAGDALSFIISVPRSADSGCAVIAELASRAPWLTRQSIIPLVDTRAYAIAPRLPRP